MSVRVLLFIFITFAFVHARDCESNELNVNCCKISHNVEDEYAAFTAITTNGDALPNGPIIYDKVITNVGQAYSSRSGIFHAPVPGVYSFSFSLMGLHSNTVYMYLYKNNAEVTRLYTAGGGKHEVASNTVHLSLEKGDEVYTKGTEGKKLYASEPYNLFSGVLIKKINF
ncbi:complement C1q tumor necrosis factor-related protein 3-like [Mytilus galloprovincialis]|uniref:C1q domain-containing protein n=1 Tax=Mytilus galloprovincialis TaxID=29158 RepID=A0A8B6CGD5_MYTGA|nr:Hypothetical predicted protein [Mytilus galloprovincialis]